MKTFAALLLLSAFAAYASAKDMAFHKVVFQFLDEQYDKKMTQALRDQGLPEDTGLIAKRHREVDRDLKLCHLKFQDCWRDAGYHACSRLRCIDRGIDCAIKNHPGPLPTFSPLQRGCLVLLHMCRKGSRTCVGELCCFVRIKRCFEMVE